ncbi:MAG TPA: hypothetical protein VFR81_23300 [Longimicrobium sp.]|nr:hypothetical protein [Longimicrobium sp.]
MKRAVTIILPLLALGCRSPDLVQPFRGSFQFAVTGTAPATMGFQPAAAAAAGVERVTVTGSVATECGKVLSGRPGIHPRTRGLALELEEALGPPCASGSGRVVHRFQADFGVEAGRHVVAVRHGTTSLGPFEVTVD